LARRAAPPACGQGHGSVPETGSAVGEVVHHPIVCQGTCSCRQEAQSHHRKTAFLDRRFSLAMYWSSVPNPASHTQQLPHTLNGSKICNKWIEDFWIAKLTWRGRIFCPPPAKFSQSLAFGHLSRYQLGSPNS